MPRIVVLVVVIGLFAFATADDPDSGSSGDSGDLSSNDDASPDEPGDGQYDAFEICKDFVKDRLRSPSSASFRNFFEDDGEVSVTGSGRGPYVVFPTVDADNGFGANIRIPFTCKVQYRGDDRWGLLDLQLIE